MPRRPSRCASSTEAPPTTTTAVATAGTREEARGRRAATAAATPGGPSSPGRWRLAAPYPGGGSGCSTHLWRRGMSRAPRAARPPWCGSIAMVRLAGGPESGFSGAHGAGGASGGQGADRSPPRRWPPTTRGGGWRQQASGANCRMEGHLCRLGAGTSKSFRSKEPKGDPFQDASQWQVGCCRRHDVLHHELRCLSSTKNRMKRRCSCPRLAARCCPRGPPIAALPKPCSELLLFGKIRAMRALALTPSQCRRRSFSPHLLLCAENSFFFWPTVGSVDS